VDNGGLWFKVLAAEYGTKRGYVTRGGRLFSVWWKDLCDILEGG